MTQDMMMFLVISAVIFIGGLFWFLLSDAKDLVRGRLIYRPHKRTDNKEYADAPIIIDDKTATLYQEPPNEVESRGHLKLADDGIAFTDLAGMDIVKIPYANIVDCYIETPGIGRRSNVRLALPGWWNLPIPIIGRVRYLHIRYNKDGVNVLLSFIYGDKVYDYLKALAQDINNKSGLSRGHKPAQQ